MENGSNLKSEDNSNNKSKTTPQKAEFEQNKENKNGNNQKTSQFQISSSNKSSNDPKTDPPKQTNNFQISSSHNSNTQNVQPFSISSSSQRPKQNFQISSSHQTDNVRSSGGAKYVSRRMKQNLEINKQPGENSQNLSISGQEKLKQTL